ncbi:MAG: hypothetical protein ACLT08_14200 [Roseburia inulinivorans]
MKNLKYYIERCYPYGIAFILTGILFWNHICFIDSEQLSSALDACNTVVALIVGFLGAILPVVLGMKNESKMVSYLFECDENKLFLKYIKETLLMGVVDLLITICLYFVPDIKNREFASYGFYVWSFMGVSFLLLTYRSLKNMLDIIFMSDNQMISNRYYKSQKQIEDEKKIEEKLGE